VVDCSAEEVWGTSLLAAVAAARCMNFIVSRRDDMVFSGLEPEDVDGGMMTLLK
jgi:hypothetical protein